MRSDPRLPRQHWWLSSLAVLALAACGPDEPQVQNNAFPGQVSAGGATSGEVIASAKSPGTKSGSEGPEGTPGIPEGAGGTTSGPNMGGTQEASGEQAPEGGEKQGDAAQGDAGQADAGGKKAQAANEKEDAKAEAEQQKQQLDATMNRLAARYQSRQTGQAGAGPSRPPDAGAAQTPEQAGALGDRVGQGPRSEKHGTAPASEDVKQPQQQSPENSGASLPADAYKSED